MIICAKTFEIEKNINISDDVQYHADNVIKGSDSWKRMNHSSLYKSQKTLNLRKENKLYIRFDARFYLDVYVFVLTLKNNFFT